MKMEKGKYEVRCWHCEFFKYYGSEEILGDCLKNNTKVDTFEDICDHFQLRSGLYTKLSYPENK